MDLKRINAEGSGENGSHHKCRFFLANNLVTSMLILIWLKCCFVLLLLTSPHQFSSCFVIILQHRNWYCLDSRQPKLLKQGHCAKFRKKYGRIACSHLQIGQTLCHLLLINKAVLLKIVLKFVADDMGTFIRVCLSLGCWNVISLYIGKSLPQAIKSSSYW